MPARHATQRTNRGAVHYRDSMSDRDRDSMANHVLPSDVQPKSNAASHGLKHHNMYYIGVCMRARWPVLSATGISAWQNRNYLHLAPLHESCSRRKSQWCLDCAMPMQLGPSARASIPYPHAHNPKRSNSLQLSLLLKLHSQQTIPKHIRPSSFVIKAATPGCPHWQPAQYLCNAANLPANLVPIY